MSETSLKVKLDTRERLKKLLKPGQTVDEFLDALLPKKEEYSELDSVRDSLIEKAFQNSEAQGRSMLQDELKRLQRKLGTDAVEG